MLRRVPQVPNESPPDAQPPHRRARQAPGGNATTYNVAQEHDRLKDELSAYRTDRAAKEVLTPQAAAQYRAMTDRSTTLLVDYDNLCYNMQTKINDFRRELKATEEEVLYHIERNRLECDARDKLEKKLDTVTEKLSKTEQELFDTKNTLHFSRDRVENQGRTIGALMNEKRDAENRFVAALGQCKAISSAAAASASEQEDKMKKLTAAMAAKDAKINELEIKLKAALQFQELGEKLLAAGRAANEKQQKNMEKQSTQKKKPMPPPPPRLVPIDEKGDEAGPSNMVVEELD